MIDRAQLTRWMVAAAEGERAAVEPLFEVLWPACVGYATRLLGGDRALAEDSTQDALVTLFGQLDRFEPGGDALTWTLTHVTWACRTARRRRAREAARSAAPAPDPMIDGRALVEAQDLVRAALVELGALTAADVAVVAAMLTDDDTARDALAPATFRKRLQRACARLRTAWRARHGSI